MTTEANVRPEVSKKSKYYISRHRYYELKHLCLQYPELKKEVGDDSRVKMIETYNQPWRLYCVSIIFVCFAA